MILEGLRQFAFRNLATGALAFEPGVTAIVGPNAAGKSNLLDAAYLASTGALPSGTVGDALRWGEAEGFVAADLRREGVASQVHVGLAAGRKVVRLDGQAVRRGDVARHFAAVRMTPQDADLVHGSPSRRRGWLDDLLDRLSPRHAALAREYARVLEQRNAGLKTGAAADLVAVLGQRLAAVGDEIGDLRARAVARVDAVAAEVYGDVAGGAKRFAVALERSQGDAPLEVALRASAAEERARGVTVVGPHRDDLALTLDGRAVQTFGSRGEARTAALALRVAELRLLEEKHGAAPLLLLDDFSAELDADRRAYLLALSGRLPQALVSGTEAPPHATRVLRVAGGVVTEAGAVEDGAAEDGAAVAATPAGGGADDG
ncbi:MAG: DNA replication and repair protein RecF [Trueperaceae bacterium]|nr:DNA replication and repair protein RecF [Trueperaceae bacterium]